MTLDQLRPNTIAASLHRNRLLDSMVSGRLLHHGRLERLRYTMPTPGIIFYFGAEA